MLPLVSVVVPCYNHEPFLDDCLMGILEQDYENIELLICDDCSTDDSYNRILDYKLRLESKLRNVIIVKNEVNLGVTKTLNKMLKLAQGELIKIIASDDAMVPHAIRTMVQYMQQNTKTDVLITNGVRISESQHYPNYTLEDKIYKSPPKFDKKRLFGMIYKRNIIFAPGAMIRRDIYIKYGLYNENRYIEDLDFWLRISKNGETEFSFLNAALIYYRKSSNSITSLKNNENFQNRRAKFHIAEKEILNDYQNAAGHRLHADTILQRILEEMIISKKYRLLDYEKIIQEELMNYNMWKHVSMLMKVKYHLIELYYNWD